MPRNIEIKARISSVEALLPKVRLVAERGPWEIRQDDRYFACAAGRLKLRVGADGAGELIFYRRSYLDLLANECGGDPPVWASSRAGS
jgi:adenylate cyclase class IV